jgi:hypothetical protein
LPKFKPQLSWKKFSAHETRRGYCTADDPEI